MLACSHENLDNRFCIKCSVFIPTGGRPAIREPYFTRQLEISPQDLISGMISHKPAEYVPEINSNTKRIGLVNWVCEISETFKLNLRTMHTTIALFDRCLESETFQESQYQAVASACLLIASKIEELEYNVPKQRYYVKASNVDARAFRKLELEVLQVLNWDLTCLTTYHFIETFISYGVLYPEDDKTSDQVTRYVRKYSEFMAELTLHNYSFRQYSPITLATACIATSRKVLNLGKVWPEALKELTQTDLDMECYEKVHEFYEKSFPNKCTESKENANVNQ